MLEDEPAPQLDFGWDIWAASAEQVRYAIWESHPSGRAPKEEWVRTGEHRPFFMRACIGRRGEVEDLAYDERVIWLKRGEDLDALAHEESNRTLSGLCEEVREIHRVPAYPEDFPANNIRVRVRDSARALVAMSDGRSFRPSITEVLVSADLMARAEILAAIDEAREAGEDDRLEQDALVRHDGGHVVLNLVVSAYDEDEGEDPVVFHVFPCFTPDRAQPLEPQIEEVMDQILANVCRGLFDETNSRCGVGHAYSPDELRPSVRVDAEWAS